MEWFDVLVDHIVSGEDVRIIVSPPHPSPLLIWYTNHIGLKKN